MNIVVMGAGAVGGYFGGKLAFKGNRVTFLVRPKRYEQLKKHGLNVYSVHGDFSICPTLAKDVSQIKEPDLVILSLKNYHLNEALPQISELVQKGSKILPLLNGVEHLDLLVSKYGKENVLGGLCQIETTLNSQGDVVQTSHMQDIIFGSLTSEKSQMVNKLEEKMREAGITVTLSENILTDIWRKYIFITSLSGITSALRQPIGVAIKDVETFSFLQEMIKEIVAIAKLKGVFIPEDMGDQIIQMLQNLPPAMTSSMHRDLQKGLPLELDSIQGAVLKFAAEYGVSTPNVKALYSLLHPFKNGSIIESE
ncbi:ketopantoate reductase family protein [Bacillus sp. Marseille-P3661]|uniref:ketopantoate reductase family protein n=1 Tax=Bacillus sp. Marseille-P3661 TaxID=1936234 RepID=UPI000C8341CE|nr:ketopantoate reductase family protein [Bacillus sp. Marseille-P3661]